MPVETAAYLFHALLGCSLIVQTLEFLAIDRCQNAHQIWVWSVQRRDVLHVWKWLKNFFDFSFSAKIHRLHLFLRLFCAGSLLWSSTLVCSIFLFASTIVLLVRWRGGFNGGSDFMTVVALTALLGAEIITPFTGEEFAWRAALWYVTLHAITSYFVSGAVKILDADWMNGRALIYFLDGGLYGPLPQSSILRFPGVARICSWSFIFWEVSFPFALSGQNIAMMFCGVAAVFHFLVFRFFSLNRFVWAWAATFPAVIFCASQL